MNDVNYFPWRHGDAERYLLETSSLIDMLRELPDGSKVTVNAVGNLAVLNECNVQIGYVEIRNDGGLVLY